MMWVKKAVSAINKTLKADKWFFLLFATLLYVSSTIYYSGDKDELIHQIVLDTAILIIGILVRAAIYSSKK